MCMYTCYAIDLYYIQYRLYCSIYIWYPIISGRNSKSFPTSGIFSTSPEDPDRHPSWTPASARSSLGECVAIVFTSWEDDSRFSLNCNGPRFPLISWSVCCSFIFFIFHDPSRLYNKERCWKLASNGHEWTSFVSKGCSFHLNRKATESNLVCKIWTTTTLVPYHIFI